MREDCLIRIILDTGIEFATEIIARFAQHKCKIKEIPTRLRKDKRTRKPHLRTFKDGFRHLYFILLDRSL